MKLTLCVFRGSNQIRSISFDQHDCFLVGRSTDAHLSLPSDKYFSRNHFLLEVNPPRCRLRDLGSANGTFVNGERVTQIDLHHGDIVTAGETSIEIQIETATPSPASTGQTAEPPPTLLMNTAALLARKQASRASPPAGTPSAVSTPAGSTETPMPTIPGYRLLRELARGGMGVVYLAESTLDRRQVAIKTVIPQIQLDELHRKMFAREIKTLSALRHPNIVNFVESGHSDGIDFYVMEPVPGRNLHEYTRAQKTPLPWPAVRALALQCLDALSYTHRKNIVHRDIKPGNIMIQAADNGPVARILDFGLAKNYEDAGSITLTGQGKGSIPFMPPEQVLNCKNVGPLSDLYSMTAVIYFMLSGKNIKDFPARQDPIKILLEGPVVPLAKRGVATNPALEQFLNRGLAKDPYRRFSSAEDMIQALQALP